MSSPLTPVERARAVLLRLDRSALIGLTALVVVAAVVAVVLTMHGRPRSVSYIGDGSAAGGSVAAPASVSSSVAPTPEVVVDVVGRVRRPGLVHVAPGARVADVIEAAGGFKRASDAASVNQARVVSDGEQVVVGGGAGSASAPVAGGTASGGSTVVDLNAATLEQLESLPGVGPVLAQRILEHRTTSGRFGSVDELRDVSGIGEKKYADIAPHVRV